MRLSLTHIFFLKIKEYSKEITIHTLAQASSRTCYSGEQCGPWVSSFNHEALYLLMKHANHCPHRKQQTLFALTMRFKKMGDFIEPETHRSTIIKIETLLKKSEMYFSCCIESKDFIYAFSNFSVK